MSWYKIVDSDACLEQGDFIFNCPIIIHPSNLSEEDEVDVDVKQYDVIVMSQSCDLVNQKIDLVLVCPIWQINQLTNYSNINDKEALRRGEHYAYHLLNKCEDTDLYQNYPDFFVVEFRNVYSVPFNVLSEIAQRQDQRLRLIPPYREHLSQSFARFFMRVGLPNDIAAFR